MEIFMRGNKVEITEAMSAYVKEKLSKLDKYIMDEHARANVLVKIRNYTQKVEVTIPLKTLILRAEDEKEDFYAAVDQVVTKLEKQLRKNKEKLKYKKDKTGIAEINIENIEEVPDEEEIIKRKKIDVKPMSLEEAILQMELLGHNFYLYKDSDTDSVCVVYKRNDTGYGVIESE